MSTATPVEISDMYPIMQCNNHRGGSVNLWSRAWKNDTSNDGKVNWLCQTDRQY